MACKIPQVEGQGYYRRQKPPKNSTHLARFNNMLLIMEQTQARREPQRPPGETYIRGAPNIFVGPLWGENF